MIRSQSWIRAESHKLKNTEMATKPPLQNAAAETWINKDSWKNKHAFASQSIYALYFDA